MGGVPEPFHDLDHVELTPGGEKHTVPAAPQQTGAPTRSMDIPRMSGILLLSASQYGAM
jgi:hypothetical protein